MKKSYKHFFISNEKFMIEIEDVFSSQLSHYYLHPAKNFLEINIKNKYRIDADGIPVVSFPGKSGDQHNPVTIAQFALALWELELLQSKPEHSRFLKLANWFVQNHEAGKWRYFYDDKISNLRSGWISAMAQGQGISVLLRAYSIEKKNEYLQVCEQAIQYFQNSISQNGVTHKFDTENWWFEEYPNPQKPAHVFNGHIFALFGIWDYYRVTKNKSSKQLFTKGLNAVISQISNYDNSYWVLYDQRFKTLLNASYMDLHIRQLEVLHAICPKPVLQQYINGWNEYFNNHRKLFMLTCKRAFQKLF